MSYASPDFIIEPGRRWHRILDALAMGPLSRREIVAAARRGEHAGKTDRKHTFFALYCMGQPPHELITLNARLFRLTKKGSAKLAELGRYVPERVAA